MAIDIGPGATDRPTSGSGLYTIVEATNPANATGTLTSFEAWAKATLTLTIGTFSGSGTSYTPRDYESIGSVTAGSKQTFTGKNCDVVIGDFLGHYTTADLEAEAIGTGYYKSGNQFTAGQQTYTAQGYTRSVYATGLGLCTVTTQACTDVAATTATGNGNITSIEGGTPTIRGHCWVAGTSGDPTTANSEAHADGSFGTGAYTTSIIGLDGATAYRVRAYATNPAGTGYGATVQLSRISIPVMMFHYMNNAG